MSHPISLVSRITNDTGKDNSPHPIDNIESLVGINKADIINRCGATAHYLRVIFKLCENLRNEDNFNNTFLLKKYHSLQTALQSYGKASAKIVKGVEYCCKFPINLYGFTRNYIEEQINGVE